MRRPRRNHTAAYKAKVALAALKGDKTLAELSEKFDVHASQIVQWKTQLLDGAMGVLLSPAEKRESQGPSVKDMQAKIGQLALENEWKGHSDVEVGHGRCHDADSIHFRRRRCSNDQHHRCGGSARYRSGEAGLRIARCGPIRKGRSQASNLTIDAHAGDCAVATLLDRSGSLLRCT